MDWGKYWREKEAKWRGDEEREKGWNCGMYIPQDHIREVLDLEDVPIAVELWENGNYNEYGGEVGSEEVYP